MKTAVLLLSLLLLATMAVAQSAPQSSFAPRSAQSSPTASPSQSSPGDELRGCVRGKKGDYTLTDHQGKQHRIVGDDHLLWDEVGHEVEVTGTPSGKANTLKETEITDIASRCWNFTLN
jgi:photosystem II stability/assembly factor-like uncharacterized protein